MVFRVLGLGLRVKVKSPQMPSACHKLQGRRSPGLGWHSFEVSEPRDCKKPLGFRELRV